ncbi:phage tail protein [Methylobacterium gnaphalii]|uniref:Phage tail protein n=1 Tax=Methylobacterium gnaphalii TaxID=1010610 RepID=A0A512JMC8_9HYPH|nr:phage tail protein [Methylobacterium gnaphalii]GEP11117.1 hypothetical protein MGN01_29620 [Methylobacterium gnaphalii]GJD69907.1 hypothetical protein MMMDOFMJ_2846 [Methylobacterium gnaphalii]GLS50395.1 hypothetical protein GCM10007885_32470 [Methylobacterium gnaphalii]
MPGYPAFPTLGMGIYGPVAPGSSKPATPAVLTASFGGKYSQRAGDGINALSRDFSFKSASLPADRIKLLEAFLIGRAGYKPFMFLVPYEDSPRQFIAPSWSTNYDDQLNSTITAKFEENFDP